MALSGMITFGLLVVLMDCLNGQITHPDAVMIRTRTKAALIKCHVDSATFKSNALHWYKAPPKGVLQRLIYFEAGSKTFKRDPDAPRKITGSVNDAEKDKPVTLTLTIPRPERSDEGSYYCALWSGDNPKKVFGSGTRLYVTDQGKDKPKAPTLSGYLPSKKDKEKSDKHGKQTILCQASGMFPDLVKFEWKKNDVAVSEGDVVEQRNESPAVTVTSMLIVDKDIAQNVNYKCTVIHEGITAGQTNKMIEMKQENSKPSTEPKVDDQNPVTCPPSTEEPVTKQISGDSEQIPSMFLFVYSYGVLLMKNGLFFCVVSIFLLKRKAGRKDKSSET